MWNIDIPRIEAQSRQIRSLFRSIERIEWSTFDYAMELCVQLGHFADILLRQHCKLNAYSQAQNNKILADELCDILLNLFSILDAQGISISNTLPKASIAVPCTHQQRSLLYTELFTTCASILRATVQGEPSFSHVSLFHKALQICEVFAKSFSLDIEAAFSVMHQECIAYVTKHSSTTK